MPYADAIAESFKWSEEIHGLKFNTFTVNMYLKCTLNKHI